jgi:hypothetical protein
MCLMERGLCSLSAPVVAVVAAAAAATVVAAAAAAVQAAEYETTLANINELEEALALAQDQVDASHR